MLLQHVFNCVYWGMRLSRSGIEGRRPTACEVIESGRIATTPRFGRTGKLPLRREYRGRFAGG